MDFAPAPRTRADEVLGLVGLMPAAKRKFKGYSLGMKQRLGIAAAMLGDPRVLILDEPTSALGVKQAGVVLRYILQARDRGVAVIFITHNPHHAWPVGDRFLILKRGQSLGNYAKSEITRDELVQLMAGGAELEALSHEIESLVRPE
jgi:simple sugar transport system ATP-binding protein